MKPGDLVRYTYYTGSGARATATGILLGPCNHPSRWCSVLVSGRMMDCPQHALEVISDAG